MKIIDAHIQEINQDRRLQFYGSLLCLCYLYFWIYLIQYDFDFKLSYSDEAICWPFFYQCDSVRLFSQNDWKIIFFSLSFGAIANSYLFIKGKIKPAYYVLIFLEILRLAIILFDYRVRLNQNYMFTFVVFIFLFVANKSKFIPRMLVLFYFWAGILKLNSEWLSGSAIYGNLFLIPESLKALAAKYVVFLEIGFAPLLLLRNRFIKYAVLFQLLLFHLVSLSVVGFFYPALMLTLLAFFILLESRSSLSANRVLPSRNFLGNSLLLFFSVINMYPHFIPGDKSITGETRLVSLHMFDSVTYCESWGTKKFKNSLPQKVNLFMPNVVRIRCDPIVFLSRLRNICANGKSDINFKDVDFTLDVRKSGVKKMSRIVEISDFCSKNYSYTIWGRNEWIKINEVAN